MLKPYSELRQIDVLPYCERRKAKDDNGSTIEIPYLNWARCVDLLHENGAESVYFTPLKTPAGSYLFESKQVANKDGRTTGCYFVAVEIHIDDKVFTMESPLLNGSIMVYDDTLNQLRISNAHTRAFVKGVAIHTGLGFGLWSKGDEEAQMMDDLSNHSIFAIKRRIEELLTARIQRGMDLKDILRGLNINERQLKTMMGYFDTIDKLEKKLAAL